MRQTCPTALADPRSLCRQTQFRDGRSPGRREPQTVRHSPNILTFRQLCVMLRGAESAEIC
jgi:hypothetical protein